MLDLARIILRQGYAEQAGRCAYTAAHHAAVALIFERTGRLARTHRGTQFEFYRLVEQDGRFSHADRQFLTRAYNYKFAADYAVGDAATVTTAEADEAIAEAGHLVETIEAALHETNKETPP